MRNLEAVEHTAGLIYSYFIPVLCKFFILFLSFRLAPTTSEQWSETLATCVKTKYKSSIANPSDIPFCCSPFPYALFGILTEVIYTVVNTVWTAAQATLLLSGARLTSHLPLEGSDHWVSNSRITQHPHLDTAVGLLSGYLIRTGPLRIFPWILQTKARENMSSLPFSCLWSRTRIKGSGEEAQQGLLGSSYLLALRSFPSTLYGTEPLASNGLIHKDWKMFQT